MSGAIGMYIPAAWEISVTNVLTTAGFEVTVKEGKLANGEPGHEYHCTRHGVHITLSVGPIPGDPSHHSVLGFARPKDSETMFTACDALARHGALDNQAYEKQRRRKS